MRSSRAVGASVYSMTARLIPRGSSASAKKAKLSFEIVYLPIAAVDGRQRRRVRIGGEKRIEPLARGVAIGKIKMAGNFAPHPGAACGPVGDNPSRSGTAAVLL